MYYSNFIYFLIFLVLSKKAFTLVELIVVITILAILGTIAFISYTNLTQDASKTKIISDLRELAKKIEVDLSKWKKLDNLIWVNTNNTNLVNTWSTILSWSYILWNLDYWVWILNFKKLKVNRESFKYKINWEERDYIFSYVKTPKKIYYQFAWEFKNNLWKYNVLISWNYFYVSNTDTKWLISENWYDIWLKNWDILTWSLY